MQGPGDQKQIRKSKHDEKENRRLRAEQYKYHCTPEHRHQKENQSAAGIPKSRKIKFGAAGTHGNDHFRMRGLRDLAGIGLAGLRCSKTEVIGFRGNSCSEITRSASSAAPASDFGTRIATG